MYCFDILVTGGGASVIRSLLAVNTSLNPLTFADPKAFKCGGPAMALCFQTTLSSQGSCRVYRHCVPAACSLPWRQTTTDRVGFLFGYRCHNRMGRTGTWPELQNHMTHPVHMPQSDAALWDELYVLATSTETESLTSFTVLQVYTFVSHSCYYTMEWFPAFLSLNILNDFLCGASSCWEKKSNILRMQQTFLWCSQMSGAGVELDLCLAQRWQVETGQEGAGWNDL